VRIARFTQETIALSDAVEMSPSMPTPHSRFRRPAARRTRGCASPPVDSVLDVVVQRDVEALLADLEERRDRAVADAARPRRLAVAEGDLERHLPDMSLCVRVTAARTGPTCRRRRAGRYSSVKMSQICSLETSPPSASVFACTTPENSIWSLRGRSSAWSVFSR
jgi:hypothetical protein